MDTNIIGRSRVLNAPGPEKPDIVPIYTRGLFEAAKDNGNGIGLPDIARKAAVEQLAVQKTCANALTSGSLAKARRPVVAPDDECELRTTLAELSEYDPETAGILSVQNTQDFIELRVSTPIIPAFLTPRQCLKRRH